MTATELEARKNAESAAAANVGMANEGDRPLQKSTYTPSYMYTKLMCTFVISLQPLIYALIVAAHLLS